MPKYVIDIDESELKDIFVMKVEDGKLKSLDFELKKESEDSSLGAEKRKSERWRANNGEIYYYVSSDSIIYCSNDNGWNSDNRRYDLGNYFKTEQEAKFAAQRLKVYNDLKDFAIPDNEQTMDTNIPYYYICYNKGRRNITINDARFSKRSGLYFASESDAQKAIDFVGEDLVRKYYLGVMED